MTVAQDRVAAAIADLNRFVPVPVDHRGPIPLADYFPQVGLDHVELPTLTRGAVRDFLRGQGMTVEDLGDPAESLAGFIFAAGRSGWAFVNHADIVPRRRFTAAHELGHFLLHRGEMGRFRADTDLEIQDADNSTSDRLEREANRFAAELLMPEAICRSRAAEMLREYGCCPRLVLAYRLASELLVSREAARYRLKSLGVGT